MGSRALALGYLDLLSLVGMRVQYLLKGMVLTLSTRIYLDLSSALFCLSGKKLKLGEEGSLAIGCSLCKHVEPKSTGGTYGVFGTVSGYDISRDLVVPNG